MGSAESAACAALEIDAIESDTAATKAFELIFFISISLMRGLTQISFWERPDLRARLFVQFGQSEPTNVKSVVSPGLINHGMVE